MKPAFHTNATIHGYLGSDLIAEPIQVLYDWGNANEPATECNRGLPALIPMRLPQPGDWSFTTWSRHRFTDLFTLLITDGEWIIISNGFHLHP